MITGIAHICYHVADLERSIVYYVNGLGFQHAFDFRRDTGERHGCYLHLGGRSFVELFQRPLAEPADGQSYRHMCLEVDDMDETVAALRGRGIQVSAPKLGSDQSWQAWLTDPDGNRIELHAYTPSSWQSPHLG